MSYRELAILGLIAVALIVAFWQSIFKVVKGVLRSVAGLFFLHRSDDQDVKDSQFSAMVVSEQERRRQEMIAQRLQQLDEWFLPPRQAEDSASNNEVSNA